MSKRNAESEERILHMWEDDYLMIELLPKENLDFLKSETARIDDFGAEHQDGIGYSEITVIQEKPVKTLDKKIPIDLVIKIFSDVGLAKISKVMMQGVRLLEGEKVPLGFGTDQFAVICEHSNGYLEDIWITGFVKNENDRRKLEAGLIEFGHIFGFLGVNWFECTYYGLQDENQVKAFIP